MASRFDTGMATGVLAVILILLLTVVGFLGGVYVNGSSLEGTNNSQLSSQSSEISSLNSAVSSLQNQISNMTITGRSINASVADQEAAVVLLMSNLTSFSELNGSLLKNDTALANLLSSMQAQAAADLAALRVDSARVASLMSNEVMLQSVNQTLTERVNSLTTQVASLNASIGMLTNEVSILQKELATSNSTAITHITILTGMNFTVSANSDSVIANFTAPHGGFVVIFAIEYEPNATVFVAPVQTYYDSEYDLYCGQNVYCNGLYGNPAQHVGTPSYGIEPGIMALYPGAVNIVADNTASFNVTVNVQVTFYE